VWPVVRQQSVSPFLFSAALTSQISCLESRRLAVTYRIYWAETELKKGSETDEASRGKFRVSARAKSTKLPPAVTFPDPYNLAKLMPDG